jgi:hypothetical protein
MLPCLRCKCISVHFLEMAQFCDEFRRIRSAIPHAIGTRSRRGRWNNVMNRNSNGTFGIIVGGVVAVIAAIFILSGGELGGKKTIEGDQDLPPVASAPE